MQVNRTHQPLHQAAINTNMSEAMMQSEIKTSVIKAWKKIAPLWPLQNLIACNPVQGLQDLPFEQARTESEIYFQGLGFDGSFFNNSTI